MNNLKIKSEDEKIKVFLDDKEIKYITGLKLNLKAGEMRNVELKCIVDNIDVETGIEKVIELSKDNSIV